MTHPFRSTPTPKHQKDRRECEHYSSYLKTLKKDFNKRCGYCNDIDLYKIRSFNIDHFVPRNPKDFTHSIKPNYYYNLIYACNYCNSAKSNKFPTKDPDKHNDGKIGFIKPTDDEYSDLFYRDKDGTIYPINENLLSEYIIRELNLKNPIHSLMWRLEKLVILTEQILQKVEETKDHRLIDIKHELLEEYFKITRIIFSNND